MDDYELTKNICKKWIEQANSIGYSLDQIEQIFNGVFVELITARDAEEAKQEQE